jgi:hypothetical protein
MRERERERERVKSDFQALEVGPNLSQMKGISVCYASNGR